MSDSRESSENAAHGHVSSVGQLLGIWAALMVLTVVTVAVAQLHFGVFNLLVAMAIAVVKGSLVVLYFMHMKYETPFNAIAFVSSLLFLALFIAVTLLDAREYEPNVIPGYAPVIAQAKGAPAVSPQTATVEHGASTAAGEIDGVVRGTLVDGIVKVEVTANDLMQFSATTIEVPAGATVELTLKHIGSQSKEVMGHNLVILVEGEDFMAYGTAAVAAKEFDYIPPDLNDQVLAHTKLLGGGESDTITFTAPGPGTSDFLCSFPGHFAVMKGKFVTK